MDFPYPAPMPFVNATDMSKNSTSKASQTDWEYIDALQDEDIDLSYIPEITEEQMAQEHNLETVLRRVIREELTAMGTR